MTEPADRDPRKSRRRQRLAKAARFLTWFTLTASVLGFVGQLFWLFDLFAEFRLQFAFWSLVFGIVWCWRRRWMLAGAGILALVLNLVAIVPLYQRDAPAVSQGGTELRIVQANLFYKNRDAGRIRSFLERENADVVCLYEFSGDQAALIPWLEAHYPFHADAPLIDDARSAIYSRYPLSEIEILRSAFTLRQGVRCTAEIEGQEVDFFVFHPTIPIYPGAADGRNGQLEEIASLAENSVNPAIMVGDFNITPFSAFYPPKRHPGLHDMGQGFGPLPTFPSVMPLFIVPIDHMFATKDFTATHRRHGSFIGSDHFPIVTDLVLHD